MTIGHVLPSKATYCFCSAHRDCRDGALSGCAMCARAEIERLEAVIASIPQKVDDGPKSFDLELITAGGERWNWEDVAAVEVGEAIVTVRTKAGEVGTIFIRNAAAISRVPREE